MNSLLSPTGSLIPIPYLGLNTAETQHMQVGRYKISNVGNKFHTRPTKQDAYFMD